MPCVDLALYLKSAQMSGQIGLTLPWVVEYLSQMDPTAPLLDYYQVVFLLLMQIYR